MSTAAARAGGAGGAGGGDRTEAAERAVAEAAVRDIAASFAADGYALVVDEVSPQVRIRIDALGDACPDCLVPSSVLVPMLAQALDETSLAQRTIQVRYPEGSTR